MVGDPQVWIGLVNVRRLDGNDFLPPGRDAIVHVFAMADDPKDYAAQVVAALKPFYLEVKEIDGLMPLREHLLTRDLDEAAAERAREVERDGMVRCHDFYAYSDDLV